MKDKRTRETDGNKGELYDDEIPKKDADGIDIIPQRYAPIESDKTLTTKNHDLGRRS